MCPVHLHPRLRALEEAEETEGLIQALDSVGVAQTKAAETAGTKVKPVPVITIYVAGKPHVAS